MERTARPTAEIIEQLTVEQESAGIARSASPQTPRGQSALLAPRGRGAERASPAPLGRRAFTLVELLMVIVIIGILVALVTLAVGGAVKKANQAKVLTEINQLSMALENYQQKHGSYPPNPGTEPAPSATPIPGAETVAQRQQRLERHFRRKFPRVVGNYTAIETAIRNATTFPTYPATSPYRNGLELLTMDGAEALVFFLGGIPNPDASNLLTGFSADPANPFQQQSPTASQRTQRFFEFEPTRLVDRDGDGWPEYVPDMKTGVVETAPYAYFDAGSYHLGPHYPWNINFSVTPPDHTDTQVRLADLWGYAVPYGKERDTTVGSATDPTTWEMRSWQSPDKFQIICAGLDGNFGGRNDPLASPVEDWKRIFPSGEGYKNFNGGAPPTGYLDLDSDNLANFSESAIGDVEVEE